MDEGNVAYGVLLASVPEQQIFDFQSGTLSGLTSSKTVFCSHLIAYWIKEQPLGGLLGEAIDGGALLRADLWHPLLKPGFHSSAAVQALSQELIAARNQLTEEQPDFAADQWSQGEIGSVVDLFAHAASRREAVARFLEPPYDEERARRVVIPLINKRAENSNIVR